MPKIEVIFKQLAASAVARSAQGIAVLIVLDDTDDSFDILTLTSITDLDPTLFTAGNVANIKDALAGVPSKLIVVRVDTDSATVVNDAIAALGITKYNWIGLVGGDNGDQTDLSTFIKGREAAGETKKAIVFNVTAPDSQHVVNFATSNIVYADGRTATGDVFIPRLLGLLSGIEVTLAQSATYKAFPELLSVTDQSNNDSAVAAGKLFLFNDEGTVRLSTAVNSLTTFTGDKTEDMSSILITESMDMIKTDIQATFKDSYLAKYKNKYDNQVLLISAINSYFNDLVIADILDDSFDNQAGVDIEAQRNAWLSIGKTEAAIWTDSQVKNNSFKRSVFLNADIKILDAMENFKFSVALQ
ncbi:phage tail sheath C-terminal domain-containing protein [Paenibacillus sp. MAH-36]|uniref:Phage tail sheath C-terminal domain-containing protein n=2 Tax=Paenibacillus TaxID=44249 RepID=A0ABU3R7V6_9BACL|nr:phage tail sheath C-terminal domain-containing protein [Paenibacillus sp. PFR10]MDU0200163.1 phage tail sheath C-terminal domain-containing protein [Paenibacillus sp. PFR10]